jgi:hypothetical protein
MNTIPCQVVFRYNGYAVGEWSPYYGFMPYWRRYYGVIL